MFPDYPELVFILVVYGIEPNKFYDEQSLEIIIVD